MKKAQVNDLPLDKSTSSMAHSNARSIILVDENNCPILDADGNTLTAEINYERVQPNGLLGNAGEAIVDVVLSNGKHYTIHQYYAVYPDNQTSGCEGDFFGALMEHSTTVEDNYSYEGNLDAKYLSCEGRQLDFTLDGMHFIDNDCVL